MATKPRYTVLDFERDFPDDSACLHWLFRFLYPHGCECPRCQRVTRHHRVKGRKSFSCQECGHHVHPTAGTIYHKSSTPLKLWFYAVFLMSSTRCGVSAKQLERELGVTYKTAWRMFRQIRSMLNDERPRLSGETEVDETLVGGKVRGSKYKRRIPPKTTVVGAVQRDGGPIVTKIVPNHRAEHLVPFVKASIEPGSRVNTDEHSAYRGLSGFGYVHVHVRHWDYEYVRGTVHTNSIEGFWGNFKGGMRGVYKKCGQRYLQSYLDEYTFRYNRRRSDVPMFQHFMAQTEQQAWWTPYCERK